MSEPRPAALARLLARVGRCALVANPALVWLTAKEGRLVGHAYLRHLVVGYVGRGFLAADDGEPRLVPCVPPVTAFPEIDVPSVEILHPVRTPGSVTNDELFLLSALVQARQPLRLVEIGTAAGRTALNLLRAAPPEAILATFDLPDDASAVDGAGPDFRQFGLRRPGRVFEGTPLAERIELVRADTTTFDWTPYHGQVDFMFIDGAHDYASVAADSRAALAVVKPGGLIVWHDYAQVLGVTQALNELLPEHKLVWLAETSLACLRR